MALVQELGHVTYGVRDLDGAVEYLRDICQLEVNERRSETVFLTGDTRHHWVRLEQKEKPGLIRLGYRATSHTALQTVTSRLDERGLAWWSSPGAGSDRIAGGIRFRAPDGLELEIYEDMLEVSPSSAIPRGIVCLLHAVVTVPDPMNAAAFYQEVLDFRRSDRIEDLVVFLRCGNQYHHSLAFAKGSEGPVLDHMAFLIEDFDVLMRFRAHGKQRGALADDVVKHMASNSASVYLNLESEQLGAEFCTGHNKILDDDYTGRLLKAGPTTVNVWSDPFPKPGPRDGVIRAEGTANGGTAASAAASAATNGFEA